MLCNLWHRIRNAGTKKALILMYHQVCEKRSDPWELAVYPDRFEQQLGRLKRKFDVVSIDELVHSLLQRTLRKNMVAITFDDGFADNYSNAAPLLEWYRLPATFYIATNALKHPQMYWWDELQAIILNNQHLPFCLDIRIGSEDFSFHFRRHSHLSCKVMQEITCWRYGMPVPNERIALYLGLWQRMQPLTHEDQRAILDQLRAWAGTSRVCDAHSAVMGTYQVQKLSASGLFSIGAHTVNHAMLGAQDEAVQAYEVQQSKREIEKLLGKNIHGFAYPYGNYNATTKSLLREAGYQYAVSTESRVVTSAEDLYALPRVQVKNWQAAEFSFRIQQLMN